LAPPGFKRGSAAISEAYDPGGVGVGGAEKGEEGATCKIKTAKRNVDIDPQKKRKRRSACGIRVLPPYD